MGGIAIWAGGKAIEVKVRYRELDWWRLNRDRVERNLVPGALEYLGSWAVGKTAATS